MKGELSKLQHVFRFQDDLISFNFNDHGYLESCINNIYPSNISTENEFLRYDYEHIQG